MTDSQTHLDESRAILAQALSSYNNIAISFSGAEDVVLIDLSVKYAIKNNLTVKVFSLDTGRLHPETYKYLEQIRNHYPIELDICAPEAEAVQKLVKDKGLFSFYQDGHQECCNIRKVEPLRKKLRQLDAWISGQRRDQNPGTRSQIDTVESDALMATEGKELVKFNPLANWSSAQVWEYIRMFDVPYNPLHNQGFTSIGCQPCTRAILPNQHEREGRWWWEENGARECGLHSGNLITRVAV